MPWLEGESDCHSQQRVGQTVARVSELVCESEQRDKKTAGNSGKTAAGNWAVVQGEAADEGVLWQRVQQTGLADWRVEDQVRLAGPVVVEADWWRAVEVGKGRLQFQRKLEQLQSLGGPAQ